VVDGASATEPCRVTGFALDDVDDRNMTGVKPVADRRKRRTVTLSESDRIHVEIAGTMHVGASNIDVLQLIN